MVENRIPPTSDPAVNALVDELLAGVQAILGNHLAGMYLEGSLAAGNFDQDSDIDFVVATDDEITDEVFAALKALHARLAVSDSRWATELEGSYIPVHALRRYDPQNARHPNIQRGDKCVLMTEQHDYAGVIHRYILREYGITLVGPDPKTLIDPISSDDLRRATVAILRDWGIGLLADSAPFTSRGYQSFTVLSICRALYTLEHGTVVSKQVAARWMRETQDARWEPLIERAWAGRQNPHLPAEPEDVSETLKLVRYAMERVQQ